MRGLCCNTIPLGSRNGYIEVAGADISLNHIATYGPLLSKGTKLRVWNVEALGKGGEVKDCSARACGMDIMGYDTTNP